MAWSVELSEATHRELSKLDAQHRNRIPKFLHERVGNLDDPLQSTDYADSAD